MSKQNNLSLYTLQKKLVTEESCRERLFKLRFPNGFICPKCGSTHYYYISTRKLYECSQCHYQLSITAGTIFHKTRISLNKWFWAIYLCCKDKSGISALTLQKHLNISYQTAWLMLHKIRKAMKSRDENYYLWLLFERPDVVKNNNDYQMIFQVAIRSKDRKPMFTIMRRFKNDEKEKVLEEIRKDLEIKSQKLGKIGLDIDEKERKYINKWLGVIIKNLKESLKGTYHGGYKKHLQRYLDEYSYRFNRKNWEKEIFNRLLVACVNTKTITYKELTKF